MKLRKIKPTEKHEIKRIIRHKSDSKLMERVRIIRLTERGYSIQEIAYILDCDVKKIRFWIRRFNAEGIKGLYDRPRQGRPDKKSHLTGQVIEIISQAPSVFGEAMASWTLDILLKHVQAQTGQTISISTLRRILRARGWKCRSLKNEYKSDAPTREEKKKRLADVAKEIVGDTGLKDNQAIVSIDEAHWDLKPRIGRIWMPPDKRLSVDIPENKGVALTSFGCLDILTGKFIYKLASWGTALTFRMFLYQIAAQYIGKELHVILDNASIHTAEIIQEFLQRHPNFHFHYLLPRGSEVNPIERFWLYSKDKVKKGASFQKLEELYRAMRKFFWRYSNGIYSYRSRFNAEKLALSG